jgi:hypothetical protein
MKRGKTKSNATDRSEPLTNLGVAEPYLLPPSLFYYFPPPLSKNITSQSRNFLRDSLTKPFLGLFNCSKSVSSALHLPFQGYATGSMLQFEGEGIRGSNQKACVSLIQVTCRLNWYSAGFPIEFLMFKMLTGRPFPTPNSRCQLGIT